MTNHPLGFAVISGWKLLQCCSKINYPLLSFHNYSAWMTHVSVVYTYHFVCCTYALIRLLGKLNPPLRRGSYSESELEFLTIIASGQ